VIGVSCNNNIVIFFSRPCVGIKKEPPEEQQWFCPRCRIIASKGFDKKQKPTKAKPRRKNKKK